MPIRDQFPLVDLSRLYSGCRSKQHPTWSIQHGPKVDLKLKKNSNRRRCWNSATVSVDENHQRSCLKLFPNIKFVVTHGEPGGRSSEVQRLRLCPAVRWHFINCNSRLGQLFLRPIVWRPGDIFCIVVLEMPARLSLVGEARRERACVRFLFWSFFFLETLLMTKVA